MELIQESEKTVFLYYQVITDVYFSVYSRVRKLLMFSTTIVY